MSWLTHFMSECKHFEKNRTAAHHAIVRAVVSALRESHPAGWQFFYETPFSKLPFELEWADARESRKERNRRPDLGRRINTRLTNVQANVVTRRPTHHTQLNITSTDIYRMACNGLPGLFTRCSNFTMFQILRTIMPDHEFLKH